MLANAFRVARMDLTWSDIETTPGVYNFSAYDVLVEELTAANVSLLFIFDYGNSLYTPGGTPPTTPAAQQAFANYALAAVERYHGRGIIWEEQNEPNGAWFWPNPNATVYGELAVTTGRAIKARFPNEIYIGPATSGIDLAFIEGAMQVGVLDYFDAISVHPYRFVAFFSCRALRRRGRG